MSRYVDGFVFTIKPGKMKAYKKMASDGGKAWMKHGALQYVECVGNDMNPDMHGMKCPTFPQITKPAKGEKVGFSFIVFKSKKHRDAVNAKVMKEMSKAYKEEDCKDDVMPFDFKKMTYGGFESIVDL
ncbi:MAG: DUF1428 domain-containing protein [Candidatus Pacearchaeota archaeon]